MAKNRDLRMEQYGISQMAYRELVYFCLQYEDKRRRARSAPSTKREDLLQDVAMIDQTAAEAAPNFREALLQNVTARVPYERLAIPCGRRQFYAARRRFFCLLARRRKM